MANLSRHRRQLARAARESDPAERALRVAAAISAALREAGVDCVLVGGAAVEVYTRGGYTTADLDFVADSGPPTARAMQELGFERSGRGWIHRDLEVIVEFPSATLAPASATTIVVEGNELKVIAVEDLIVDRLAAWKHWGWHPDGAAAALLLGIHGEALDRSHLSTRAEQEDVIDALTEITKIAEKLDRQGMDEETLTEAHGRLGTTGSEENRP